MIVGFLYRNLAILKSRSLARGHHINTLLLLLLILLLVVLLLVVFLSLLLLLVLFICVDRTPSLHRETCVPADPTLGKSYSITYITNYTYI